MIFKLIVNELRVLLKLLSPHGIGVSSDWLTALVDEDPMPRLGKQQIPLLHFVDKNIDALPAERRDIVNNFLPGLPFQVKALDSVGFCLQKPDLLNLLVEVLEVHCIIPPNNPALFPERRQVH